MFSKFLEQRGIEQTIGNASAFARWLLENAGGDNSSGVNVSETSALALTYVYACINVLSQTLAHVPLELMKEGNKGPQRAKGHNLYDLMKNSPNQKYSSYDWRETMEGHRNGWGNSYSLIIRDKGRPVALEILYPDSTIPRTLAADGSVIYESTNEAGSTVRIAAPDMLHFAGLGWDGIQGYSPIQKAKEAIGLGLAIHQFGGNFFRNGASPKGIIESEVPPNTLAPFVEQFKKQYGGLEQANGTPILPKGLTYKAISINPDDAQTLETLKLNRTEIAGMFRVPPQFIMDLERSTFTNAAEMDLHFVKHTMTPIFTNWESELNRKLLTDSERRAGYYFKFNDKGLLRGATTERFAAYHTALQDGWMNRNEVRALEELETQAGLDEFLVPNNMVHSDTMPSAGDAMEEISPPEQPLVDSVAERMAANKRKTIERLGEDIEAVANFYSDYPKFVERIAMPLAKMLAPQLNCGADEFVRDFTKRHIDKQLSQMINRVGDLDVTELAIVETFYEVKNGY